MKKGKLNPEDIEEVIEEKGERLYNVKGLGKVPSVTTVLHRGFPQGIGLIKWFMKSTEEEINKKRHTALDKGTALHEIFERWSKAGFKESVLSNEEKEKIRGAIQWKKDLNPRFVESETACVYSDSDMSVAGRVDLVCVIGIHKWLVDLKTGRGTYDDYPCQLGIYSKALGLTRAAVLLLTDTKKGYRFVEVDIEEGFNCFKAVYKVYKYLKDRKFYVKK